MRPPFITEIVLNPDVTMSTVVDALALGHAQLMWNVIEPAPDSEDKSIRLQSGFYPTEQYTAARGFIDELIAEEHVLSVTSAGHSVWGFNRSDAVGRELSYHARYSITMGATEGIYSIAVSCGGSGCLQMFYGLWDDLGHGRVPSMEEK